MTPDCSSLDTYAIVQSTHKRKVVDAPTGQYIQMQDDGYDVSSILNHRPFSTVELGNNEPIVKYSTTIEQQQQQAKTSNLSANNWKPTLHITIPDYLSVAEEATTLGSNHNYNHTPVTINSESTRSSCYKSLTLDEINTYESETDDDNGNESFVENLHTPIPWLGSISKIIWEFFEAGQPSVLGKDYE